MQKQIHLYIQLIIIVLTKKTECEKICISFAVMYMYTKDVAHDIGEIWIKITKQDCKTQKTYATSTKTGSIVEKMSRHVIRARNRVFFFISKFDNVLNQGFC